MSFFEKIKTMFNLGGINVEFHVPTTHEKHKRELKGEILLQAAGERKVKKVYIALDQHIEKENDGNKHVEIVNIGKIEVSVDTTLKAGEAKAIDFILPFQPKEDFKDKVANKVMDQGGLLSVIGAVGAAMHNIETTYTLKVKTDIEGALFKPEEAMTIQLI